MRILADPQIPLAERAFAGLGEVELLPGRAWTPAAVRDYDVLLVRSVTRVDAALLEGSAVQFVGTATSGIEHVDTEWLAARGIGFGHAHGANATAVAEYVLSSVLRLAPARGWRLRGLRAGIVGCGAIGSRVARLLGALGVECRLNDPPRAEREPGGPWVALEQALEADVVTVHVPLTPAGPWPTAALVGAPALERLPRGACLINAARGGVVEEPALSRILARRSDLAAVIDCWTGEPAIDAGLLARASLTTPHIAGHSVDGRIAGTEMVYRAACAHFAMTPEWRPDPDELPEAPAPAAVDWTADEETVIRALVLGCYDVQRDSDALKATLSLAPAERAASFDALRRGYPPRREFHAVRVAPPAGRDDLAARLRGLGFELDGGAIH